jgi:AcrR family transcriptional regulator
MDGQSKNLPPLPAWLGNPVDAADSRPGKRERTRRQLVAAAVQVLARRGVAGATIQEIATVSEMTPATVYNHFDTKDDVVQAVALWIAETLCRRIAGSYGHVREGAERMAIGNRRYIRLAAESPQWAMLVLDVGMAAPHLVARVSADALADLRLGVRQKSFRIASEAAAMDLINGTVGQAMRTVARGEISRQYDSMVAATVLRGLGMNFEEAMEVARRPLPDLPGGA